jgi:hypothetical protein
MDYSNFSMFCPKVLPLQRRVVGFLAFAFLVAACASGDKDSNTNSSSPVPSPLSEQPSVTLTITKIGIGLGTITSNPAGLNCGTTCRLTVTSGTVVTLIATPAPNNTLADWGGACPTGRDTCVLSVTSDQTVTVAFNTSSSSLNMVVMLAGSHCYLQWSRLQSYLCVGDKRHAVGNTTSRVYLRRLEWRWLYYCE